MSELISGKFILNTSLLKIDWRPYWRVFELSIRNWENSYYEKIRIFRREFHSDDFLLDSTGRKLVFLGFTNKVADEIISNKITELEDFLQTPITYDEIIIKKLQDVSDTHLQDTITNALGEYLSYKLQNELGFEKTGSIGSVGRFFHHKYSKSVKLSSKPDIDIVSQFIFVLHINWSSTWKPYLSIDVKSQVDGKLTLYDLMKSKKQDSSLDLSKYKKDQLFWKVNEDLRLAEWKEIFRNEYELIEFMENGKLNKVNPNLFSHGDLKNKTLDEFLRNVKISLKRDDTIAVLKKRNDPNPNTRYYWPSSLLVQKITNSYVMGQGFEKKFHKLSKPTVLERKNTISSIFKLLEEHGLTNSMVEFDSHYPEISFPSVKGKYVNEYGKIPPLWSEGVEKWGKLKNVIIYSTGYNEDLARKTLKELYPRINELASKSNNAKIEVKTELYEYKTIQNIAERVEEFPEETIYIFIKGKGRTEPPYNKIKEWFTIENKKPVQFLRASSLIGNRLRSTIRTVIPQLLAKTGGLPYELSPKILDKALIVGLDKGRDTYSDLPSASAGIAAVTPKGEYVAGVSTKIDTTKHDAIDVDELAPELLERLVDQHGENLEYVVILRDGSPQTSKPEVEPWKRHLEKYGLKMIFFASRKENPYRVFPKIIHNEKRTKYKLPIILNGIPLPQNEFLAITANPIQGTPQPVLYTLMANTTNFEEGEIINKVIPQVLSMSMLCWESPHPTSQPLPLHYADKLAEFTQKTKRKWRSSIRSPMFI